ncbi:MAG: DNA-binding protein [Actinomycetota bacterium]|nr:DNA-binding protein [Actinomycetota bacterium]
MSVLAESLLYDRVDAARLLAISPRKFDDLRASGEIPTRYQGSKPVFHIDDLRAYAAALPTAKTGRAS